MAELNNPQLKCGSATTLAQLEGVTVMSNHKKLKQLSCEAPPGDHLCRITFIQAFSKADPPQKVI